MNSTERAAFWDERPNLCPSSSLEKLAEHVLLLSIKRSPKWKFRLAADLVMELQAKPKMMFLPGKPRTQENLVSVRVYNGLALMSDAEFDAKVFVDKRTARGCWRLGFEIQDWILRKKLIGGAPGGIRDLTQIITLQHRIVDAFEQGFFERLVPSKMFSWRCLCCGKLLTDPASQARMIGPECAGNSSENIRRIFDLQPIENAA